MKYHESPEKSSLIRSPRFRAGRLYETFWNSQQSPQGGKGWLCKGSSREMQFPDHFPNDPKCIGDPFLSFSQPSEIRHSVPSASQTRHTALFEHRTDMNRHDWTIRKNKIVSQRWDGMGWHGFAVPTVPRGRSLDSCHMHLSSKI